MDTTKPSPNTNAEKELTMIATLRTDLSNAKAALKDAELNAQVNAEIDGKNAEARKLQMENAVRNSPEVIAASVHASQAESAVALAELDAKSLGRQWRGALALAELQAAKINWMARSRSRPSDN